MMNQLITEIDIEINSMFIIVSEIDMLLNDVGDNLPTNVHKTALGGMAAQFYNGVENIFKRIHKHYHIELPSGEDWHLAILERFSPSSSNDLPIKLSEDLLEKLTNYRRFRHYFFHGYSHSLNWEILKNGVNDISEVFEKLKTEIYSKLNI